MATANLGCKPDLASIATSVRNAEYNPKRFRAVILRLRNPKSSALVFASGKIVVTGARSEDDARTAARKVAKIIRKVQGPEVTFAEFKVQNIVGSGDIGFPIRLEAVGLEGARNSSYEPELFPGLVYRLGTPLCVVIMFVSGRFVITGAKLRSDIIRAAETVYPVMLGARKAPGETGLEPPLELTAPPARQVGDAPPQRSTDRAAGRIRVASTGVTSRRVTN
jgi:transcription initiation factor TFIID TATA-box-binding protein